MIAAIKVHSLGVQLPGATRPAIDQLSFELGRGQMLAVIGANGAGKTSLLQALAERSSMVDGVVDIRFEAETRTEIARQKAVLPQENHLDFPFSVHEVVAMSRIPHKTGLIVDKEIVFAALQALELTHLVHRNFTQLSGGERQRAHIARVLAQVWRAEDALNEHRLLLLDEPTVGLDLGHQHQLLIELRRFCQTNATIVMVLHDIELAAQYADQILALKDGRMLAFGSPEKVIDTHTIQQLFGPHLRVIKDKQQSSIRVQRCEA